ncbi:hypothetical protein TNIN_131291 [Trichonephila inaurata madagascariensis]|uniref:Uncharacterized protein n=1 Tax=Trichonephila inaurata madagascariensis TaxID=2747483 RepID=A0A8X6MFU8_9ARAC|nr:hypothetical protein TNIN_131291 [Trichonephila inaurata madagascariensis]
MWVSVWYKPVVIWPKCVDSNSAKCRQIRAPGDIPPLLLCISIERDVFHSLNGPESEGVVISAHASPVGWTLAKRGAMRNDLLLLQQCSRDVVTRVASASRISISGAE